MLISINPGSGPVKDADESNACINIRAFADDLLKNGIASVVHRRAERDEEAHPSQKGGRYEFDLEIERAGVRRTIAVSMPGIPLEQVRYMDMPGPVHRRLVVDLDVRAAGVGAGKGRLGKVRRMNYRTCWACKHFDFSNSTPAYSDLTPGTPGSVRCAKSVFDYTNLDDLGQEEFRTLIETAKTCQKFEDRETGAST